MAAVNEEFSIEREYVDNIPPTPTTSRRLKKSASSCEHVDKDETLLFRAYTKVRFKNRAEWYWSDIAWRSELFLNTESIHYQSGKIHFFMSTKKATIIFKKLNQKL